MRGCRAIPVDRFFGAQMELLSTEVLRSGSPFQLLPCVTGARRRLARGVQWWS